jgi:hypothetical protein
MSCFGETHLSHLCFRRILHGLDQNIRSFRTFKRPEPVDHPDCPLGRGIALTFDTILLVSSARVVGVYCPVHI